MENEETNEKSVSHSGGKGINWTWLILGAVGLGAVYFYFTNKAAASPTPTPGGALPGVDTSKYLPGYWAWEIKKNGMWWPATQQKAKLSGKTISVQLWEDAQLKVDNGSQTYADYADFIKLVDARVALDTTTTSADTKFSNAVIYVVNAAVTAAATVYGGLLNKDHANNTTPANMGGFIL